MDVLSYWVKVGCETQKHCVCLSAWLLQAGQYFCKTPGLEQANYVEDSKLWNMRLFSDLLLNTNARRRALSQNNSRAFVKVLYDQIA